MAVPPLASELAKLLFLVKALQTRAQIIALFSGNSLLSFAKVYF
jgi:hypothetical protein